MNKITHTLAKPQMVRQGDVLVVPVTRPVDEADVGTLIEEFDRKTFSAKNKDEKHNASK